MCLLRGTENSFPISEVCFRLYYSVVTMYTASFNTKDLHFAPTEYLRVLYNSHNSDYYSLQHQLIAFCDGHHCVLCEVQTESLYILQIFISIWSWLYNKYRLIICTFRTEWINITCTDQHTTSTKSSYHFHKWTYHLRKSQIFYFLFRHLFNEKRHVLNRCYDACVLQCLH